MFRVRNVPGLCPVQKVKIKNKDGNFVEVLAILDSGSNTSVISKNVKKKLGLSGTKTHLTMNLAGGNKKSEESELINISVVSTAEEDIQKSMRAYAINKPCSPARTVSRKIVDSYPHLKEISSQLYLSGTVDLLIGTDFPDAFIDMHIIPGNAGEPIGWYVMGRFASQENQPSRIHSIEVGTINAGEDIKKLLTQDMLGVKPTELCTCDNSDNNFRENKLLSPLQNQLKSLMGGSKCACHGKTRVHRKRVTTTSPTNE